MPASSQKCIYEIHKKITKRLIGACRKGKSEGYKKRRRAERTFST